jgi:hypothetical protein
MGRMDYRQLLKKYMKHIFSCERITFLDSYHSGGRGIELNCTQEEIKELWIIEEEVLKGMD